MLKVTISYDMQDGKEQECQEYLVNKLAPGLSKLGFNITDVWFTVWGNSPQILSNGALENEEQARKIFLSRDWERISKGMEKYARNFKVSFVELEDD
ncbi:MAG: hypothetical protein AAF639_38240 [Chloroflexota bacterium]